MQRRVGRGHALYQMPAQPGIERPFVEQVRWQMDLPVPQVTLERAHPFGNAGFAAIDLLSFANKADNDAPIRAPVHDREQKGGFGHVEAGLAALLAHEIGSLVAVPSALGFIANHDMFGRDLNWVEILISKAMNVLNEFVG